MQLGSFIPLLIGSADAPLAHLIALAFSPLAAPPPSIPCSVICTLHSIQHSVLCHPPFHLCTGAPLRFAPLHCLPSPPLYSILQPTIPLAGSARAHLSTFAQASGRFAPSHPSASPILDTPANHPPLLAPPYSEIWLNLCTFAQALVRNALLHGVFAAYPPTPTSPPTSGPFKQ